MGREGDEEGEEEKFKGEEGTETKTQGGGDGRRGRKGLVWGAGGIFYSGCGLGRKGNHGDGYEGRDDGDGGGW